MAILIKELNKNTLDKKRTQVGLEVVMLLYHWSFIGNTSNSIDFTPGHYYERVKRDFSDLPAEDAAKIRGYFPDSPPGYFLKMEDLGVAPQILEDYLSYYYKKKYQRCFEMLITHCLSPKPKIDLNMPFQERWNRFINEGSFAFIYIYFDLENEQQLLKEKIIHHAEMNNILSKIPTGREKFLKWRRFVKSIKTLPIKGEV